MKRSELSAIITLAFFALIAILMNTDPATLESWPVNRLAHVGLALTIAFVFAATVLFSMIFGAIARRLFRYKQDRATRKLIDLNNASRRARLRRVHEAAMARTIRRPASKRVCIPREQPAPCTDETMPLAAKCCECGTVYRDGRLHQDKYYSHGYCDACMARLFPDLSEQEKLNEAQEPTHHSHPDTAQAGPVFNRARPFSCGGINLSSHDTRPGRVSLPSPGRAPLGGLQ